MSEPLESHSTKLNRILEPFVKFLYVLCSAAIGVFLALMFIQIVLRYVFSSPIYGMEEAVILLMVWSMAIGNAVVYWKHEHAVIEFVLRHVPHIFNRIVAYATDLIVVLSAIVYISGGLTLFKLQSRTMPLGGLPFSRAYYYALPIIVMGGILLILSICRIVDSAVEDSRCLCKKKKV
jgi:TRAP-type C4-dicarboxylate transport system permease small subunit